MTQVVGGAIDDAITGRTHSIGENFSTWAQNTIAGAEMGAAVDIGAGTGGTAIMGSGALGNAGFGSMTFGGHGQSWSEFSKQQLKDAAVGAALGGLASKAAPILTKIPGVKQAVAWAGRGVGKLGAAYEPAAGDSLEALLAKPTKQAFTEVLESASQLPGKARDAIKGGLEKLSDTIGKSDLTTLSRFEPELLRPVPGGANAPIVPHPGDASFVGPIGNESWTLSPRGQGAHLFEQINVEGRPNMAEFNRPYTPRYYPEGTQQSAGQAHLRLHEATRAEGIRLQGGNPQLADPEVMDAYGRAYGSPELQGIRGSLRTPNGKSVVGTGLTPAQAWDALIDWFAQVKQK